MISNHFPIWGKSFVFLWIFSLEVYFITNLMPRKFEANLSRSLQVMPQKDVFFSIMGGLGHPWQIGLIGLKFLIHTLNKIAYIILKLKGIGVHDFDLLAFEIELFKFWTLSKWEKLISNACKSKSCDFMPFNFWNYIIVEPL